MPKFLTQTELFSLIQRELPEGVYAETSPSGSNVAATIDASAQVFADAYDTMMGVYDNLNILTATDDKIGAWETKFFGKSTIGDLTIDERKVRVIGKMRAEDSISLWDILVAVVSFMPIGDAYVQVVEWAGRDNQWYLGESLLGRNTVLGHGHALTPEGVDPLHPSAEEFLGREQAFTYEVRIFSTIPAQTLIDIDNLLNQIEPARSRHIIYTGLNLLDYGLTIPILDVDRFSKCNCISRTIDPGTYERFGGPLTTGNKNITGKLFARNGVTFANGDVWTGEPGSTILVSGNIIAINGTLVVLGDLINQLTSSTGYKGLLQA